MIQYEILTSWDKTQLVDQINVWLAKGWSLQGGVSVGIINNKPIFYQSIIKKIRVKRQDAEITNEVRVIIDYLFKVSGKKFTLSKSNIEPINARLTEGFTVDQCKRAIDNVCAKWLGDAKMEMYIRPVTIFGKQKFESYVNASGDTKRFSV